MIISRNPTKPNLLTKETIDGRSRLAYALGVLLLYVLCLPPPMKKTGLRPDTCSGYPTPSGHDPRVACHLCFQSPTLFPHLPVQLPIIWCSLLPADATSLVRPETRD